MRRALRLTLALAAAAGAAAASGEASRPLRPVAGEASEKIVNGVTSVGFPSVVALLVNGAEICTGTLVGCDTVLTAAHCVCASTGAACQPGGPGLRPAASIEVFAQHGGFYAVSSIAVPPAYAFAERGDVAVLRLASTANGITPTPINTRASPGSGVAGTIVGFGYTHPARRDNGVKRTGQVTSAGCGGIPESTHVCWTFLEPLGAPGTDSNTCGGDSGGPLLMDLGCGATVAGVTSGGFRADCQTNDASFDADVFVERAWIAGKAGGDLESVACGSLAPAGTAGAPIHFGEGALDAADPEDAWTFDVPSGTGVVHFVLNGEDGLGNDFDLHVKRGSPPTVADHDCRGVRDGTYEACEVAAPAAGTWHVLVSRSMGAGEYQLVVTSFREKAGSALYAVGSDVDDGSSALYRIRRPGSRPAAILVGETGVPLDDVAIDPTTGRIHAVGAAGFYELSATTGAAAFVGPTGPALVALDFDSTGQAYALAADGDLHVVDATTGVATLVGPTGFASAGDLAVAPGGLLYASTGSQLLRVDPATGAGTLVGPFGLSGAFGLDVDADGTMYAGRGAPASTLAELHVVNPATARTAFVGAITNLPVGLHGLAFLATPDAGRAFADGFEPGHTCGWSATIGFE